MITTLDKGYFTTIQDEGRWGYQAYGMPIAGAMDRYSYRIANLLVGNPSDAAVIEMTDVGASFKFDEEQYIAICGANMQAALNGMPIAAWSSLLVPKGSELRFSTAISGYRTYLAIRGGIDVPAVLQSRSTYTRAKIGGNEGRTLYQGDKLSVGERILEQAAKCELPAKYIPKYPTDISIRVLPGPQAGLFIRKAIETFFTAAYIVTTQSDRSGYWLNGPKLMTMNGKSDIISEAVSLGAVQVLSSGLPLIVAADHQTTRGFAKIGYVIQADLPRLAQARPNNQLHFTEVAEQEAIEALYCEQQCYCDIAKSLHLQEN